MLGCCFHLVPNKIIKYIAYGIHSCLERAVDHHHFYTRTYCGPSSRCAAADGVIHMLLGRQYKGRIMYRGQHFSLWLISQMSSSCIGRMSVTHAPKRIQLRYTDHSIFIRVCTQVLCAIDGHNLIISIVIAI